VKLEKKAKNGTSGSGLGHTGKKTAGKKKETVSKNQKSEGTGGGEVRGEKNQEGAAKDFGEKRAKKKK